MSKVYSISARFFGVVLMFMVAGSPCHDASAQVIALGSDFVSRYVWRGTDFGESASIQPSAVVEHGRFAATAWASYSLQPDGAGANELDLTVALELYRGHAGTVTIGGTDYYFPAPGASPLFDFSGDGDGSHFVEPFVRLDGPPAFPISLHGSFFAYNDPDRSAYVEAATSFIAASAEIGFVAGTVLSASDFYETSGFALVNVGITAEKAIAVSDAFALPIRVALTANPYQERLFLVVGISIVI